MAADGNSVPIETLRVGDMVLAQDEKTGETALKPITQIFVNDAMSIWEIRIVDAEGNTETHRVTNNHPYWVVGTGWVEVADLAAGMTLSTSDGPQVNIVSVHDTGVVERTYNLEVADFHTFFVGQEHVLVHNMCKVPDLNVDVARAAKRLPIKASTLERWAENQGWVRTQTATGPIKYVDENGVVRATIKRGSARTPGSETPHVELRNAAGQRIDPAGNPVNRRSSGNHTQVEWDLD